MSYSFDLLQELSGPRLTLRPLQERDLEEAGQALVSPTTWFSQTRDLETPEKFVDYFRALMIERQFKGISLSLIGRLKETNEVVSTSTFQFPGPEFSKIEIGFSWIADSWQRSFVNTEMKYLMLNHAFGVMRTRRVEFSIHPSNAKSNAAIQRIGAKFEGTLRKWRSAVPKDNGDRNIYSIIDEEWPEVKARLTSYLEKGL